MPTYDATAQFLREVQRLTDAEYGAWVSALKLFIRGLHTRSFHPRLRIKRVSGHPGVWEMTWAPDGRATFSYGTEVRPGEPHIIWRRIGTHDIFRHP